MIVVHASFRGRELLVWAEASGAKQRRGMSRFDAGPAALRTALVQAGLPALKARPKTATAYLPSGRGSALPSTSLLEDRAPEDGGEISEWGITAVLCPPDTAIPLLAACAGRELLAPGILAAADVRFWCAALRFAAGLVLHGRFLPGLDAGGEARWEPALDGTGERRLCALAEAMPGSARAVTLDPGAGAPEEPAKNVLFAFVRSAVDALVRGSLRERRYGDDDSADDAWMHALRGTPATLRASQSDIASLRGRIADWQRPIRVSSRAPFRLLFRLEEPPATDERWTLRYMLQAHRDPSLLVPAGEAWNMNPGVASAAGGDAGAMRELLLASLGQAAGLFPPIEDTLRFRSPELCYLDVAGAHRFLREGAGVLESSGFGVLLPNWWTRKGAEARLTAQARVKGARLHSGSGLTLQSIIDFEWQIALGGEPMTRKELQTLARLKAPLVKLRGQWVEVDADAIEAALRFMQKHEGGQAPLGEIVRLSLGAGAAPAGLEVSEVKASGEVGDFLDRLHGHQPFEELPPPVQLRAELRPYQRRGYSWLEFLCRFGLGACLADDMGLGKTVQALALILRARESNGHAPVLLLCPTSVVGNWQKEASRFAPDLPFLVHHGAARGKGERFAREAARHAVVLSSYSLLQRDAAQFAEVEWSGVILDEAQNIKNPETHQSRAARSLRSAWRVALTGTPVENNVGDLWSIMEFLNPGLLGNRAEFKRRYFMPIQVWGDRDAAGRLRKATGPFILRRLKTDKSVIADLPDKIEMKVFCTLTREQASLYAAVVKEAEDALESSEGIARKGIVLATLSKLKQVCNHPAQFLKDRSGIPGRSGKLARLTEMLEETLAAGDRSLVFTQFAEMGEIIRAHLQESFAREVLFLHGAVSKAARDRMVERFSTGDGPPIFLLSLKAGGTGLNLTRANHVFHFDRWWNPAVENQATDRAFRIGQTRNVQVHKFVCAGTLEDRIDAMIERKKDIAGRVVGTGEGWLTELSNAELKSLFALGKDAVAS